MQLTYIFHSGFALETDHCILVFDYWMDPAGVMPRLLQSLKPLYVFSSHFHEDHFNRDIFSWQTRKANVRYILSKDILKHRRAQKEEADAWLGKGATWEDELLRVTATGSNDSGVSWVIETDGKRIFHAGDLNNWYARFLTDDYHGGLVYSPDFGIDIDPAKEEKRFLGELKDIRKLTDRFDVVMFPVDGRIGNGYTRRSPSVPRRVPYRPVRAHALRGQRFRISLADERVYRRQVRPVLVHPSGRRVLRSKGDYRPGISLVVVVSLATGQQIDYPYYGYYYGADVDGRRFVHEQPQEQVAHED